ncbi:hypothetical protein W97_03533 [Coniosporium apollinis CBS 100218]|uniref:F-box domain-containing protein n=1 Tax=Coniosporium apollinis (strain CBS 100218) TaxID=1168221 RepID=R7YQW2_CONA1|nr:uncharacterized protein W97_03533 [Coniosporium apollinis CBS 100218]EON64302.1 hypothetical protein W97_03533 [Coniosporium apollinis CBS 100218]
MHINEFPTEILSAILEQAAKINEHNGVTFTFGLSQAPLPLQKTPLQRYVRGHVPPDMLKWDATASIRAVCGKWHDWALDYSLRDLYIRRWRGSERWAELSLKRENYGTYELIEKPSGMPVRRDPFQALSLTAKLLSKYPQIASNVRRMWLDGFYDFDRNVLIHSTLQNCTMLTSASLPWTALRHLNGQDWARLLGRGRQTTLQSLELLAVDMPKMQAMEPSNQVDLRPLESAMVNFSNLRKLKLFGDTTFMPITDQDLHAIARTATNLEEFHLTCLSTITIDGVLAIIKSSQSTLRVLEHSPRSNDGFWHPHPGSPADNEHLCEILANCPRLEDMSISLPSMCPALFANPNVRWQRDCQVRALHLCGCENAPSGSVATVDTLKSVLQAARDLITVRRNSHIPAELTLELFFADFIFDPHLKAVHGDFQLSEFGSSGIWPTTRTLSRKGPYGSTGLYGKDEEDVFERVDEEEFLDGARRRWVSIDS